MKSHLVLFVAVGWLLAASVPAAETDDFKQWTQDHLHSLVEVYRYFHQHPELSYQEQQTADRLAQELVACGIEVTTEVGGFGVVGLLRNGEGPTVMLRTDLDALPVKERTNLSFASQVEVADKSGNKVGVMHACGHDVHITNLVGVAQYLSSHKSAWSGTVMFVGQPAEERGAGAKAMLEDGLFERFPKPNFAVALHVDSTLPTGQVGYRTGYSMANVNSVDITVHGRGGHGAYPHTTIDPIVQAAQLVMALQTIVSREVKPIDPAVLTIGSIHGGTKHNIIADTCQLQITVRSYSDEVRQQILTGIERIAKGIAEACNAPPPTITISEGTPSLYNNEDLANRLIPVFEKVIGKHNVVPSEPSMGGEDFSRYGKAGVPILMYRLGSVTQRRLSRYKQLGQTPPSLHSPQFYPDVEEALLVGVSTMSSAALELLKNDQ